MFNFQSLVDFFSKILKPNEGGSFVVVLCCPFWCQSISDVSPYVCSYYVSSVSVAEWTPFVKLLLTRLAICSLCILTT